MSTCRHCGRRLARSIAAVVLVGIALDAGLAAAGSVVLVAGLSWGVLRWRSIEDRLFPRPVRRSVAGRRAVEAELLVERACPDAPGPDARHVVIRVVEVAFLAPRDGGVR